jgi:hypothetical protein
MTPDVSAYVPQVATQSFIIQVSHIFKSQVSFPQLILLTIASLSPPGAVSLDKHPIFGKEDAEHGENTASWGMS